MKILTCQGALLGVLILSGGVRAEDREEDLPVRQTSVAGVLEVPLDCSSIFDIRWSYAASGLMYSAVGWDIVAAADENRTVTITAVAGELSDNGSFTPDGSSSPVTILPWTKGRGTCDWQVIDPLRKHYQLKHTVAKGGVADESETLYGYLDLTHFAEHASQAAIEKAVLSPFHLARKYVTVEQDETLPWQPIDYGRPGVGICSDPGIESGVLTRTSFVFWGQGTWSFEYQLTGGSLSVIVDGGEPEIIASPVADWVTWTLTFDRQGEHAVALVYTAGGNGASVAIRNVLWAKDERTARVGASLFDVRADLREGVRAVTRPEEVLPFTYSSTNWIGDVQGTSALVTIVKMTGTDPDVTTWTEAVPGSFRKLHDAPGEGEVKWSPKKGVWKAMFEIPGTDISGAAWLDLRDFRGPGFLLMVF